MSSRRWTDPRDGTRWLITFNPGTELVRPRVRDFRERLIFESEGRRLHTEAVFGSDLSTLTDQDLQGILDQAREEE